jgi:hypothetical protein
LSPLSKRLGAALLLVTAGWLLSPAAVPVYDGIGQPDEPYRYIAPPAGATKTAPATTAKATSPVVAGVSSYGMSLATAEVGPQLSLYLPPKALRATVPSLTVTATPLAPTDQPPDAKIDGNVYEVKVSTPVTLTPQAALATLYLRATTAKQPPPVMQYRATATAPWEPLRTSRGGTDVYVSTFPGPGFYALAFSPVAGSSGGKSVLPYVLLSGLVLLVIVIVVVRLRAAT